MASIPTVDLDAYRRDGDARSGFVRTVRDALCEYGFLTVVGHGIDDALVRRVYGHFERFFALPEASKRAYAGRAGGQRGYTPFAVEHAKDSPRPDLKEFFHIGPEPDRGPPPPGAGRRPDAWAARASDAPAHAPNVWPVELPGLREDAVRLFRALEHTAALLLEAVALGFELPRQRFSRMLRGGASVLRALHYPPVRPPVSLPLPSAASGPRPPAGCLRAAPHQDINLITLLCEATDAGLEILPPGTRDPSAWLPVAVGAGEIVVDSGDMLSRMTNDVVPATTHRVVNPPAEADGHRYSLPFFAHPRPSCDLSVLERFVSEERPPRHPPITAGAFLEERLREIGLLPGRAAPGAD